MAWPKGKPRPESSGRKKGTPNKNTRDLMAICESKGIDVFQSMVELAIIAEDPATKFIRLSEIAKYLYPKRKEVEHSGQLEPIRVIIEDYTKNGSSVS